jgi:hypothetical protein
MSRDEGFAVMDVSTSIVDDPKFRKLYRHAPDHAGSAFAAYIATVAESWKAGRRVNVDDAWPSFLPFDKASVEALIHVGLLDAKGLVPSKAWRSWFGPAYERRANSRERWRRANERRHADAAQSNGSNLDGTTGIPRGNSADTTAIPSVPSVRPSVPPDRASLRALRAPDSVKEYRRALEKEPVR